MTLDGLKRDGKLKVAINLGNAALARQDEMTGDLSGVTVALARRLCDEIGAEPDFILFEGAGKVVAAAPSDAWDIAFLAIDKERAEAIAYSDPYVLIEATAVVRQDSQLSHVDELDRPQTRLLVARNSAYDLYLTANARHLDLVRAETPKASFDRFRSEPGSADAVAGVRQSLETAFATDPGFRFLDGAISAIEQAMALPIAKSALASALSDFVQRAKQDGFVRQALDESGQTSLTVAP
ncbi:MAG: transporter substrate-binding domain-containing protein [Fulvimarina manganoxydans]|uniref:transporter substrate-binding domain-containing protein n=1 Tax=Fulvimarina manganoxydans TaxID=937218 RepID=UPI002353394B|nr:transporter substrate-binding domain-containing protein [Fulvimarina manganoxydans]MCK5931607.1 transporter substrate-binding domain-containing protein [Fulvimarina manganoxydans]